MSANARGKYDADDNQTNKYGASVWVDIHWQQGLSTPNESDLAAMHCDVPKMCRLNLYRKLESIEMTFH